MRSTAFLACVLLAGCAGTTTAAKPKSSPGGFVETRVVAAPTRTTHALSFGSQTPADGVALNVAPKDDGTVVLRYEPDPPDVQLKLAVPDDSLGTSIKAVSVSYEADGADSGITPLQLPIAQADFKPPAGNTVIAPIGSSQLATLFANGKAPGSLVAIVTFQDAGGDPVPDEKGGTLTVRVPFKLP